MSASQTGNAGTRGVGPGVECRSGSRSDRLRAWCVRALVLLLVPVVGIYSSGQAAVAAEGTKQAGEWTAVRFELPGSTFLGTTIFKMTCQNTFGMIAVQGGSQIMTRGTECQGTDSSPGWCQRGEPDCTNIQYRFEGTGCGSGKASEYNARNGEHESLSNIHAVYDPTAVFAGSCDPATVCLMMYFEGTIVADECMPIDIEPPGALGSGDESCSYGTVSPPRPNGAPYIQRYTQGGYAQPHWSQNYRFPAVQGSSSPWSSYLIVKDTTGGQQRHDGILDSSANRLMAPTSMDLVGSYWLLRQGQPGMTDPVMIGNDGTSAMYQEPGEKGTQVVIGGGYFRDTGAGSAQLATRKSDKIGKIGWNNPGECSFYWGTKLYEYDTTTRDDPAGPLPGTDETLPVPTSPPGDPGAPMVDQQPDDSIGLLAVIAGLLQLILDAIEALAQALGLAGLLEAILAAMQVLPEVLDAIGRLVTDLLEGLKGLFVPNASSWDVAGVRNQWEARPPGSLVTGVGDGLRSAGDSFSSAGGCGQLLTVPGYGSGVSCTSIAGIPGIGALRSLVSVGFYVLTGIAVLRMVIGALGKGGGD